MNRLYHGFKQALRPSVPASRESIKRHQFYKTGDRPPYVRKPTVNESRVDQILDKINQTGFESLSEEEKEILRRASNAE
jgi:23S rRNA maturation mini-RNase III